MTLKDTVQIVKLKRDGYGTRTVETIDDIQSLFLLSTGKSHSANVDIANSDAHIYLDVEHPVLTERGYEIEGLYILANLFGGNDDNCWYEITRAVVGQRKLLDNNVDNVHAYLKKVAKP